MEHILYYNHPEKGYGFYEKSQNFPESYIYSLQDICSRFEEPKPAEGNTVAIRYSPLQDRYLLTVIFRQPDGDGLQTRGINTLVNFLLTDQEADRLFCQPAGALTQLENTARNLLSKYQVQATLPPQQLVPAGQYLLPEAQLLNAAAYAGIPNLDKQAFFEVETPAAQEVAAMLNLLPGKLRKLTSFHTGIQSTQESIDVAVNFGSHQIMGNIVYGSMSGGQSNSKKYLYQFRENGEGKSIVADTEGLLNASRLLKVLGAPPYPELTKPLLLDRVENWEQLECLTALDTRNPIPVILDLIPEAYLVQYVNTAKLSEETLRLLGNAAKDKRMKELKRSVQQLLQQQTPPAEKKPDNTKPAAKKKTQDLPVLGRRLIWFFGKVLLTAAMVFGLVWLLKSMVIFEIVNKDAATQLVISLSDANRILKILGFAGLSSVLVAWITYHITKWIYKK